MLLRPLPEGPLRLQALKALSVYNTAEEHGDVLSEILGFFDGQPDGLQELAVNIQHLTGDNDDDDDSDSDADEQYEARDGIIVTFPVLRLPELAALTKITLRGDLSEYWRVFFPSFSDELARHLPLLEEVVLYGLHEHALKDNDIASLAALPALRRLVIIESEE